MAYAYFHGWGWKNDDDQVFLSVTTTELNTATVAFFKNAGGNVSYTDITVSGSFETLEQWVTTLQNKLEEIRQKAISAE
jgi:hypothetical protein